MEEKLQKLLVGILLTKIVCNEYKIFSNQPRYINNFRIHHYQVGLAALVLAIVKKDPLFLGIGSQMIFDDRKDLFKDLNKVFKNSSLKKN